MNKSTKLILGGATLAGLIGLVVSKKKAEASELPPPPGGSKGAVRVHLGVRYRVDSSPDGFVYSVEVPDQGGWILIDDGPFETDADADLAAKQTIEGLLDDGEEQEDDLPPVEWDPDPPPANPFVNQQGGNQGGLDPGDPPDVDNEGGGMGFGGGGLSG